MQDAHLEKAQAIRSTKRCVAISREADHSMLLMMDSDAVQDLAATPSNSQERFNARSRLPGMAKRLREVRRSPFRCTISAEISVRCTRMMPAFAYAQLKTGLRGLIRHTKVGQANPHSTLEPDVGRRLPTFKQQLDRAWLEVDSFVKGHHDVIPAGLGPKLSDGPFPAQTLSEWVEARHLQSTDKESATGAID